MWAKLRYLALVLDEQGGRLMKIRVIKKNGKIQEWLPNKIGKAINQSAKRTTLGKLSKEQCNKVAQMVFDKIAERNNDKEAVDVPVLELHALVEEALDKVAPTVAQQYRAYREYKAKYANILANVREQEEQYRTHLDHDNANSNSALIPTKRALIYKAYSWESYKNFFLSPEELKAHEKGAIYIHDRSDRLDTWNCSLLDIGKIMAGGFDLENIHYNEPTNIRSAMGVACDIILQAGSSQYGGLTAPEIDSVLAPYAEKSYKKYLKKYSELLSLPEDDEKIKKLAETELINDIDAEYQGWEMKLNTLASSRGDFIFSTLTFGNDENHFANLIAEEILKVRKQGQGEKGKEKPVVFPKLVFLYDEKLHGAGGKLEWLYKKAIECSAIAQYPDYLSLSGDGYVSDVYKKWHKYGVSRWYLDENNHVQENPEWNDAIISPRGCRSFLTAVYCDPKNHNKTSWEPFEGCKPVFTGRANGGVVSLNLPYIYEEAKRDGKDFFKNLRYYLDIIRGIHKKTREFLIKLTASCNPLGFMAGGYFYGNLKPEESIKKNVGLMTWSYGITALNELQELYNGKTLNEDHSFADETLKYINDYIKDIKHKDGMLYSPYGTPAESLCGRQAKQFKDAFGIVGDVGARNFFSNSFHSPIWLEYSLQDKIKNEYFGFHNCNGGHIFYYRINSDKNFVYIDQYVKACMKHGYYCGVNIAHSYCNDCGYTWTDDKEDHCPRCNGTDVISVSRVCGYLGFTRTPSSSGDSTRMNAAKREEIALRKSR